MRFLLRPLSFSDVTWCEESSLGAWLVVDGGRARYSGSCSSYVKFLAHVQKKKTCERSREGRQTQTQRKKGERERERQTYKSTEREAGENRRLGGEEEGRRVVKSAVLQVVSSSWLSVGKRRAALSQTVASLPTALPPSIHPSLPLSLSRSLGIKEKTNGQANLIRSPFPPLHALLLQYPLVMQRKRMFVFALLHFR